MKEMLIKILIQMAIDEERRKKIYLMIISVVTGLLMLIAFFIYSKNTFIDKLLFVI